MTILSQEFIHLIFIEGVGIISIKLGPELLNLLFDVLFLVIVMEPLRRLVSPRRPRNIGRILAG